MAISFDRVDLYTQALNTAFVNAYDPLGEVAPIDECVLRQPSKSRTVNAPWIYPPPLPHTFNGQREYAKLGEGNYRVAMQTYTAEFEIKVQDIDDEQIEAWSRQAAQLAKGHNEWVRIESQINLAAGQTTTCFDGSNFFASSHTWGVGNNIVTGTASSSDSVTHAAVIMVKDGSVKPMIWFDRQAPYMRTNMGSDESDQTQMIKVWSTSRGAPAFGFWYDAILVKWSNTPTVQDMQTTLGTVNATFRGFKYPQNLPTDAARYPHSQKRFTAKNLTMLVSSKIEHIARQALTLSLIGQTENFYVGYADLLCSPYLDGVT